MMTLTNSVGSVFPKDRAYVIYQAPGPVSVATLAHELGHILGLAHYDDDGTAGAGCKSLRDPNVNPTTDHFTVMTHANTPCRSELTITGRGFRDFYETYHPGPILDVYLWPGADVVYFASSLQAILTWEHETIDGIGNTITVSGALEAGHAATHAVLFGRSSATSDWEHISAVPLWEKGESLPMGYMQFVDTGGLRHSYKLTAVNRVVTPLHNLDGTIEISKDGQKSHGEGDPTIVKFRSSRNSIAKRPEVLSASLTHRYCTVGGSGMNRRVLLSNTTRGTPSSTVLPCPTTTGTRTDKVARAIGSGDGSPKLEVDLGFIALAKPRPVTFDIPPSAAPGVCNPGDTVSIGWKLASGSGGPVTVHAHGQSSATSPFVVRCPSGVAAGSSVEVWALRKDGGGKQVNATATQPLALTGLTTVRNCVAGQESTTFFGLSGGNSPYMYTDQNNKTYSNVQAGHSKPFGYRCPPTFGVSKLTISVTDGVGRTASTPFTVNATCSLPLVAPSVPFSQSGAISSDAIRLTWSEVCADSYRVRYAPAGLDGNDVVESNTPSVTIEKLRPNTLYRFTVQALAHGEASQESLPASMMTAPTPPQPDVDFRGWAGDPGGSFGVDVSWPQVPGATTYSDAFDVSPGEVTPARIGTSQAPTCRKGASGVERICENLAPDQMYEFEVRAVNSNGDASEAGTVEFCLGPCEIRVSNVSLNSLRVDWEGLFERAPFHEVRIVQDGKVVANIVGQSKGLTIPSSRITTGGALKAETTYRAEVRTWYTLISGWGAWAGVEFTTPAAPKPDPLTLTVTPSGTTCLTSGSVSVSWSVTGGSGKYEVSVDGNKQSGSSATVTCQATAGDQSVTVVVTDKTHATLTKTQTITLTVIKPKVEASTGLSVRADVTSLTLTWKGPDGATGYGVRIDGGAETKLPATTLSHPYPGLTQSTKYKLEMSAYLNDDRSV